MEGVKGNVQGLTAGMLAVSLRAARTWGVLFTTLVMEVGGMNMDYGIPDQSSSRSIGL